MAMQVAMAVQAQERCSRSTSRRIPQFKGDGPGIHGLAICDESKDVRLHRRAPLFVVDLLFEQLAELLIEFATAARSRPRVPSLSAPCHPSPPPPWWLAAKQKGAVEINGERNRHRPRRRLSTVRPPANWNQGTRWLRGGLEPHAAHLPIRQYQTSRKIATRKVPLHQLQVQE